MAGSTIPPLAEQVVTEGKADLIAIGRALLADPAFPNKVKEGRLENIVQCLCCNNCTERYRGKEDTRGVRCTVNPCLLRESEFVFVPTEKPKRVLVVGGGVGGMTAAKVLAQRGHRTTLIERTGQLGGQWNIAAHQEFKEQYASLVERLTRELEQSNAEVVLNQEVTPKMVAEMKPDAVVLATGATPIELKAPGIDGPNVVHAYDVLEGRVTVGDRVVVVGGRLVGMETALSLARQGRKTSIVTLKRLGENGKPMNPNIYLKLRDSLLDADVRFFTHSAVSEIKADGVSIINEKEVLFLKADTVVMAVGAKPVETLSDKVREIVPEVHMIGDCVEVRKIIDATNEGAEVGCMI